jgi:hypothetical protein
MRRTSVGVCELTDVEDWSGKLDVTKVSRTFRHSFVAGGTFEGSVDGTQMRIVQTSLTWLDLLLILMAEDVSVSCPVR